MKKKKFGFVLFIFFFFCLAAFSAYQQKSDKELPFFVQDKDGNRIDLYRESYALIIGIDHYWAGWPDLPGVAKDIEDVKKEIIKQGFRVTVAKNLDRDKLLSTIEGFISKYGHDPENRLLIYFAGHGHTIKLATQVEMGYIVPADAPNPNTDDLGFKDKAIDMMRFDNFAQQIECKHVLFIFDSCFSGSIFALSRGVVPEVISYKTARPVRQFITSGSADEMVPDKSVFKSQFVSGIEGDADTDKDGFVTGTELGEFLLKQVVNYSKGTQHPQYGKIRNPNLDKGDFVFIVRKPEIKKVPPEPSSEIEQEFWKSTIKFDTAGAYQTYLKKYPNGIFSDLARDRLKAMETEQESWRSTIKLDTISAYDDYLRKYPKGSFSDIARGRVKAIQAEEEFWKSTSKLNTAAAYEDYLRKYPEGSNSENARDRLKAIQAARESEKNKTQQLKSTEQKSITKQETPLVKLIQLPPETVRMFNDKVKQLIVPGFPKDIMVQGQVNLTLSVSADGKISVDALNDAGLNVSPLEKRESVKQTIIATVVAVILDPPKDRSGKSVSVGSWQISYSCGRFLGKLVLSSISI